MIDVFLMLRRPTNSTLLPYTALFDLPKTSGLPKHEDRAAGSGGDVTWMMSEIAAGVRGARAKEKKKQGRRKKEKRKKEKAKKEKKEKRKTKTK